VFHLFLFLLPVAWRGNAATGEIKRRKRMKAKGSKESTAAWPMNRSGCRSEAMKPWGCFEPWENLWENGDE